MMDLDFILNSTKGKLLSGNAASVFTGVSTDTRKITKDELFFALKGENFNGQDFIEEAFNNGASGAVVEDSQTQEVNGKVLIQVPSTLKALGDLASSWRMSFPDLKVAAITGSNGKTTTKEMTWSIVSLKHNTLKNTGNFNNLIGLPLTLFELNKDYSAAVVEVGMNDFGELKRLSEIARPNIGAITNIGHAHLEKLGGLDGVAKAKGELVENFKEDNVFVVNLDDPRVRKISDNLNCQKVTFGVNSEDAMIRAQDIESNDLSNMTFNMIISGERLPIKMKGIGLHNVLNSLCAAGIALSLGCDSAQIQEGLSNYTPTNMRLQVLDTPYGFKIINDAYNANPDSMRRAIDELARLKGAGQTLAVLGDMLELGEGSDREHYELGKYVSNEGVDNLISFGTFSSKTLEGYGNSQRGLLAQTHEEAAKLLMELATPGDLVLVKGSRGSRMEQVIKEIVKEQD
ncbi:MAG: UDP-N-acetylmuramoyl-tripeptide--D-alanyl-D-alanine ligase [Thermodesulfobacteriota bacterium]|nr:MAG: UDP-N-acetylmuramoyl-tripeptide--D-alanyl-D-alanine ligase [Thermodesulfobacteriota bacterium]